jgi:DnaJ-class molecular chaperone
VLTDVRLKSAFRTLAHRFHPDRHPGLSHDERQRFAMTFADAAEAYRTLLAAVRD